MKKEAKIIYSNQRELVQDKMKEELDNYIAVASKEYENLLQAFESQEVEMLKAQKQEIEEFKKILWKYMKVKSLNHQKKF